MTSQRAEFLRDRERKVAGNGHALALALVLLCLSVFFSANKAAVSCACIGVISS